MAKRLNGIIVGAEAPMDRNSLWIDGTEGGISVFGNEGWKSVASTGGVSKKYVDDQLNGYTEQKQLPVREMTAEEKAELLGPTTEEEAATWGYKTFVAYTNPAGNREKAIQVKISTESGHYISFWPKVVYADTLIEIEKPDAIFKGSSSYDGIVEFGAVLPENTTMLLALCCYATEEDFDNEENPILDATFNIEITKEIEHGRVLREEDVATTKEAKLLGYVENVKSMRSRMGIYTNPGVKAVLRAEHVDAIGFAEYTAYMQNYGPMTIYPGQMTTAEEIDHYLVEEDTVKGIERFVGLRNGYELYLSTSTYTDDSGTTYLAEFKYLPSIVCIGKTGDQERWICTQLLSYPTLHLQYYIKYLAVYDAKPKLTQVAGAEFTAASL